LSSIEILRYLLDIAKVFINVWNPNSGTDMFDADMVEVFEHVSEQADLPLIRWCKIRVTAFRAVRYVL